GPCSRRTSLGAGAFLPVHQPRSSLFLEVPPVVRTPVVWGQRSRSDGVWTCSNSMGLRIPMLECRLSGLYQHSIHSKIALASSSRFFHVFRSRTSIWSVPQNDSIMALS